MEETVGYVPRECTASPGAKLRSTPTVDSWGAFVGWPVAVALPHAMFE